MAEATPRGRFVWYDLITTDPAHAIEFYTSLTGWRTAEWEGSAPYTMWTNRSVPLGGIMASPDGTPYWLAYISTPDTDITAEEAAEVGAQILTKPQDIPGVGRYAVLSDPQGAVFALYTATSQLPGHEGPASLGEFSWHELATHDEPAALRFYQRLFGWQPSKSMAVGVHGRYQTYARNGLEIGGMYRKPAAIPGPPAWLHYIRIDDVHRGVELIADTGGQVVSGPTQVPDGDWVATALDPQGARFAVHAKSVAR